MRPRQVELARLPDGDISADDFRVVDTEPLEPSSGEVVFEIRRLGLNAGLAHRIGGEGTAYGPGLGVGDVPASDAVVEIVRSESPDFAVGDLAVGTVAWSTVGVCDATHLRPIRSRTAADELETHLTLLGHVGLTAYAGMIHIGDVRATDVVYVSAAAGGVGSCAVQFAKASGATVFGCAGTDQKVSLIVDELGADGATRQPP